MAEADMTPELFGNAPVYRLRTERCDCGSMVFEKSIDQRIRCVECMDAPLRTPDKIHPDYGVILTVECTGGPMEGLTFENRIRPGERQRGMGLNL